MKEQKKPNPHRSTEVEEHFFHRRGLMLVSDKKQYEGRRVEAVTAFVRPVDGVYYASYAECDSRDQFNRRRGRTVARRKWFAGKREEVASPTFEAAFRTWQDLLEQDAEDAHLFIG